MITKALIVIPFDPTKNGTQGESIETVVGRVISKKLNGDEEVRCVRVDG